MADEKYRVKVKGVAPLVMHKFNLESEDDSRRGKKNYVPEEEAEKAAYRNQQGQLILPTNHFKASMVKAATDFKISGKKTAKEFVKSGILMSETETVLDPQEYEVFTCPVVVNRSRIPRSRPMIRDWTCEFTLEIIDDLYLDKNLIKEILETAGKYKGVGDNRPEYGRFEVVEFEKLN